MKFTDLLLADRIRMMIETKNINLIYDILDKHFPNLAPDEIRRRYKLRGDFIKTRLYVSSDSTSAILDFYNMTSRLGLNFESITNFELRVDLYEFINKIL